MKFHNKLNSKLFENDKLKEEVNDKLNEIADAFIEFLDIPRDAIKDAVITGSNVSYNYTKNSDLDLHLLVDYDKVHEDCPIVNGYLISKKSEFNKNHDIFIYDIPVEVYAESIDNDNVHNGLWSIWDKEWIDFPQKIEPTNNDSAVQAKYQEFKDAIEQCDDSEVAIELMDKLKKMRKAGLEKQGEFSTENLAFKKLRDEKMIDKLANIKKQKIDKQLSLESYNEEVIGDKFNRTYKYSSPEAFKKSVKDFRQDKNFIVDDIIEGKDLLHVVYRLVNGNKEHYCTFNNTTLERYYDINESIKESVQDDVQEALTLIEEGMSHLAFDYNYDKFEKKFNKIREMKQPKAQLKRAKELLLDIQGRLVDEEYDEYNEKVDAFIFKKNKSIKEEVLPHNIPKLNKLIDRLNNSGYWKVNGNEIRVDQGFGTVLEQMDLTDLAKEFRKIGFNVYVSHFSIEVDGLKDYMNKNESIKESLSTAKVTFDNGDTITTDINGTEEEIKDYYAIGKTFNLGKGEYDNMAKVVSVEILNESSSNYFNKVNKYLDRYYEDKIQENITASIANIKLPIKDEFIDSVDLYEVKYAPELIDVQFIAKDNDGNIIPIYVANGIIDTTDGKWNTFPEVKWNILHLEDKEKSYYMTDGFNKFKNERHKKLEALQQAIVKRLKDTNITEEKATFIEGDRVKIFISAPPQVGTVKRIIAVDKYEVELDKPFEGKKNLIAYTRDMQPLQDSITEDITTLQDKIEQADNDLQDLVDTLKQNTIIENIMKINLL